MQVTMLEVLQIVKDLPNAKSLGLDGLNGESLKYTHPLLCLFLVVFSFFEKNYLLLSCATSVRLSVRPSVRPSVVCGNIFFSR